MIECSDAHRACRLALTDDGFRKSATHPTAPPSSLSRLQIRLPSLDRDLHGRIGSRAPKLAPIENHSVEPVRVFTLAIHHRVGKHMAAPDAFDDAGMSAGIAWQACMAWRIDVAGAHAVAWLEFRRRRRRPVETAAREEFRRVGCRERPLHGPWGMESAAGSKLVIADKAELHAQIFQAQGPFLVVAAGEIDMRRQRLTREPPGVDGPQAEIAHGTIHGENAALPRSMEHRLAGLTLDFAEAVHAAHVMDAVHKAAPGARARPVPIMQSRVTRLASRSSLQSSAPAGRIGTTR